MNTLLEISVRSLAVAALAALGLRRVKSAAWKHAVWTMVTASMLLQIPLSPALPPLSIPVLRPVEAVAVPVTIVNGPMLPSQRQPVHFPIVAALYFAAVLFFAARFSRALVFTRRLVQRSESVAPGRYQSSEIAVPLTAGSKILLPLEWTAWEPGKLRAVLAHEEAHVRRRDAIVALLARVNRCVFWFHPLAWWLERELAQLAEQACDDAALAATQDRQQYARTLLDMARAVHASQGRFLTAGMAKETNVEARINRILDESRRIPKALGKLAWAILAACAGPLIYFAAAVQLAPAQALMSIPAPAAPQGPVLIAQAAPAPLKTPPAPAPQAQPDDPAKSVPKAEILERFRRANEQKLKAELSPKPEPSNISIAFSPLRSGVISIPLGDPIEHEINARITTADGRFVLSADGHSATASSWEMPVSLKPGIYRLNVLIKTGNVNTRSSLDFTVE